MRGEFVIVRAFGGKPLVRRLWDVGKHVVYITNNSDGPVGFPIEDVFKYDQELIEEMEALYRSGKWDWSKLTHWNSAE